jgi:hypothetical protein
MMPSSWRRLAASVAASAAFWWLVALAIEWFWPTAIARSFSPHWFAALWFVAALASGLGRTDT